MREQLAQHTNRRASATREELEARRTTATTHRTGHNAGLHPEDMPYHSGKVAGVPEEDSFYPRQMPSSTRRYTTTQGQQVIEQGNKRVVIHNEPPPQPKRQVHWLVYVGLVCFLMISGWIALTLLNAWWQAKQLDWKYGTPRTFQVDQYVGHGDSPAHPNHFIAVNVGGTIEVVELNTTNPKNDHIYMISTITDSSTPVTVSFADLNHDGKRDMLVTIGVTNPYTVVLLDNGSVFQH